MMNSKHTLSILIAACQHNIIRTREGAQAVYMQIPLGSWENERQKEK
jgi:hypothetical protein